MILLDTDIIIDFFRGFPPALVWFSAQSQSLVIPGFVALELYAGCANKNDQRDIRNKLVRFAILWPSIPTSSAMIDTFASAHLTHSLGILDALIAATALAHSLPLHTFNQKHFTAVPGLRTIQPYTR